jgi:undecaprenyl pyrophosphate phosphatase UppP
MIPAALVGIFFEDEIDSFFSGNILLVGIMLIGTGGLLFLADRAKASEGKVTRGKAIIVGISQAIAILPGISRSGATIGTSVLLGVDRTRAARFSFLMVVPLIFGAMAVKTKNYLEIQDLEGKDTKLRTELIISELNEDLSFSNVNAEKLEAAIYNKEMIWGSLSKSGGYAVVNGDPLLSPDDMYRKNLAKANLTDKEIDKVVAHDLGKIRAVKKTSKGVLIAGFLAAFITGLFACTWMIAIVKKSKLKYFAYYCFVVGTVSIIWTLL